MHPAQPEHTTCHWGKEYCSALRLSYRLQNGASKLCTDSLKSNSRWQQCRRSPIDSCGADHVSYSTRGVCVWSQGYVLIMAPDIATYWLSIYTGMIAQHSECELVYDITLPEALYHSVLVHASSNIAPYRQVISIARSWLSAYQWAYYTKVQSCSRVPLVLQYLLHCLSGHISHLHRTKVIRILQGCNMMRQSCGRKHTSCCYLGGTVLLLFVAVQTVYRSHCADIPGWKKLSSLSGLSRMNWYALLKAMMETNTALSLYIRLLHNQRAV